MVGRVVTWNYKSRLKKQLYNLLKQSDDKKWVKMLDNILLELFDFINNNHITIYYIIISKILLCKYLPMLYGYNNIIDCIALLDRNDV